MVGNDDDILSNPEPEHVAIDRVRGPAWVNAVRHNHQDIEVAMFVHVAPGGRAKEVSTQGMNRVHYALHKLFNLFGVGRHLDLRAAVEHHFLSYKL